ncbi:excisionase family protein, partial [Citrobacter cronae]
TEKTGLSERQIKSYRLNLWIEGVHFKHLTALGETDNSKGLLWYNYPKINQLVQDA